MDIRVSGHQVDTGEALRAHVDNRLTAIADKYFSRTISAQVTFGKGPHDHGFTVEIVAYVPQGVVLKSSDRGAEAHAAFDAAAEKIEKQLRRYTKRLKDRQAPAPAHVHQPLRAHAGYRVLPELDGGGATVSAAVMMLDLRNTNALMFRNSGTGSFNMVYRRGDGTIGWVEPQTA